MSLLAVQGGATGTGTVTILAPSTNTNQTLTLPDATDTVAGIAATQTLTNKTLTAPVISSITNTGTLTLPTSTDTLVGRATTDTLTNKTINASQLVDASVTQAKLGTNVAGNGPAFSATRDGNGNQTVSAATYTKVLFPAEEFDTNSNFASSTFTPTVAGYYQLNAAVGLNSTGESLIQVYKNGANFKTGQDLVGTIYNLAFSALVYANGTTDYFEVYAYPGAGTIFSGSAGVTYFQASMVRSA